ncbi:MAG: hypothetical protein U5N86_02920 [Planctomycetota bacterium]|nr:hypothetical protein [Planctomycetota bacterium]
MGRITLNLTPLLDLLLILVFASLLHTWTVSAQTSSQQLSELETARELAKETDAEAQKLRERLEELRAQLASSRQLAARLSQYEMRFGQAVEMLIELARKNELDERQREKLSQLTEGLASTATYRERMELVRSVMTVYDVCLSSDHKALISHGQNRTEVLFDAECPPPLNSRRCFATSVKRRKSYSCSFHTAMSS